MADQYILFWKYICFSFSIQIIAHPIWFLTRAFLLNCISIKLMKRDHHRKLFENVSHSYFSQVSKPSNEITCWCLWSFPHFLSNLQWKCKWLRFLAFDYLIKLRYCEKATTSFDINVKISGRFFSIFVAMDKINITSKSMFCKARYFFIYLM